MSILVLKAVSKRFGRTVAADAVDLDIPSEFFALLGPSGSGKTTMLRIIAGLEQPDRGRVLIHDEDVTREPPYRRGIGMVFQDFLLFPHRTVAENILFPLRMQRSSAAEQQERLAWITNLVRLGGLEERYPHQLSGGQKQRVALARGLVSRPKVLLLDEPLANLDRELRREMEVEIRRFQIELGIPFVYVTHNQEEALTMADRMAVMRDGRLEQVGAKLDLYHRPRTPFVASFLGVTNCFVGTIGQDEGQRRHLAWQNAKLPLGSTDEAAIGDQVVCYVKSEKIRLSRSIDQATIGGMLRDTIFKGAYADYLIEVGDHQEVTVSGPVLPELVGRQGERIGLTWTAEDAVAFKQERLDR